MSGGGREEREGSRSLRRLVMEVLVGKREAERVPLLAGALCLQLLLVMSLHCRAKTQRWSRVRDGDTTTILHIFTHLIMETLAKVFTPFFCYILEGATQSSVYVTSGK